MGIPKETATGVATGKRLGKTQGFGSAHRRGVSYVSLEDARTAISAPIWHTSKALALRLLEVCEKVCEKAGVNFITAANRDRSSEYAYFGISAIPLRASVDNPWHVFRPPWQSQDHPTQLLPRRWRTRDQGQPMNLPYDNSGPRPAHPFIPAPQAPSLPAWGASPRLPCPIPPRAVGPIHNRRESQMD